MIVGGFEGIRLGNNVLGASEGIDNVGKMAGFNDGMLDGKKVGYAVG